MDEPIGYAKVEDGAIVETVFQNRRPPAGYLPVFRIMPSNWDSELQAVSGEWIYTILADRIEQRPDWFFYPVEQVIERLQRHKIIEVRRLQLERMQAALPGIDSPETAEVVVEIMRSILPAALSLSAKLRTVRDTVTAANNAVAYLNGLTDIPTLRAYDPRTGPNWP